MMRKFLVPLLALAGFALAVITVIQNDDAAAVVSAVLVGNQILT